MSFLSDLSASVSGLAAEVSPRIIAAQGSDGRQFSGFVWRTGAIVVPEEMLDGEDEIEVLFADGHTAMAKVAGRDSTTDVALLSVTTDKFSDWVDAGVVIPGALGVVVGRSEASLIARLASVISVGPKWQSRKGGAIDARITLDQRLSRMSEGSAVAAHDGSLVGMAVTAAGGRAIVIPTATIALSVATLADKGYVPRAWLGVMLHPSVAGGGAIILKVDANTPAADAGLMVGDVITTWNGESLGSARGIAERLATGSVGTKVKLGVSRAGNASELEITIGERPRH